MRYDYIGNLLIGIISILRTPLSLRSVGFAILVAALSFFNLAEPTPAFTGTVVDIDKTEVTYGQPASLFLGEVQGINLDDMRAVFTYVFSRLDNEVKVLPTENYLYFRFFAGPKYIWGNMRLSPEDRDKGLVHFAYYEFNKNLIGHEIANVRYRVLGLADGITIQKFNDFRYSLTYDSKTVNFLLNQLEQTPPRSFTLPTNEEMLFRLHDESNIQFFLLFNRKTLGFMYVADEDNEPLEGIVKINDDLVVEKDSGFAFYIDAKNNGRKILMGVRGKDVRQNTYYDGPFDQLADNYIDNGSRFAEYVQLAYPFTRGRINQRAVYTDFPDSRLAITPYYTYESLDQIIQVVAFYKATETGEQFYRCIAHDYQQPSEVAESTEDELASGSSLQDEIPPGTPHCPGITYQHFTEQSWIPPGTPHCPGITYQHFTEQSWIPPGSPHCPGITYQHFAEQSWIPPGSPHCPGITYQHFTEQSWIPPGTPHCPGITYQHFTEQSWIPPGTSHCPGITYQHFRGISWKSAVGGYVLPTDKLALLAPWIALASIILGATVIYFRRVKHRKEEQ